MGVFASAEVCDDGVTSAHGRGHAGARDGGPDSRKLFVGGHGLATFYHRSPDQISDGEVQAYLLHLIRDRQRSWNTCHIVVHGLRFFYHTTLKRDRTTFSIPTPRQAV